jgi:hypothetical protein
MKKFYFSLLLILTSFMVQAQEPVIISTLTNFLWVNFQNPIEVEGINNYKEFSLITDNGTIIKTNNGNWLAIPNKIGQVKIGVIAKEGNKMILLKEISLKVKAFPMATSSLSSHYGGDLPKGILSSEMRLSADVLNFDIDIHFDVISYHLILIQNGKVITDQAVTRKILSCALIPELKNLNSGDLILINNIMAKDKSDIVQKTNDLTFIIK